MPVSTHTHPGLGLGPFPTRTLSFAATRPPHTTLQGLWSASWNILGGRFPQTWELGGSLPTPGILAVPHLDHHCLVTWLGCKAWLQGGFPCLRVVPVAVHCLASGVRDLNWDPDSALCQLGALGHCWTSLGLSLLPCKVETSMLCTSRGCGGNWHR